VLGIKVGDSEDETFWTAYLRRLKEQRGLTGVRLAISDAHAGLKKAIARCFQGCSWQRCRVHFARNLLVKVPKVSQGMVAAALRSVFVQQEATAVAAQWDQVITMLTEKFPAAAALMAQAKDDVLAFRSSPPEHWRKIWSTNPLERLNVAPRGALSGAANQTPHPRRRDLPQRRRHYQPGGALLLGKLWATRP
jgi:transposase-like protein